MKEANRRAKDEGSLYFVHHEKISSSHAESKKLFCDANPGCD